MAAGCLRGHYLFVFDLACSNIHDQFGKLVCVTGSLLHAQPPSGGCIVAYLGRFLKLHKWDFLRGKNFKLGHYLIFKPFSPTPGSMEHRRYPDYLKTIPHQDWSPHVFPFSSLNNISHAEYHHLYRMAAFLNNRVRGEAFDFLKSTMGLRFLKESLRREVWKLAPSTFSVVD